MSNENEIEEFVENVFTTNPWTFNLKESVGWLVNGNRLLQITVENGVQMSLNDYLTLFY